MWSLPPGAHDILRRIDTEAHQAEERAKRPRPSADVDYVYRIATELARDFGKPDASSDLERQLVAAIAAGEIRAVNPRTLVFEVAIGNPSGDASARVTDCRNWIERNRADHVLDLETSAFGSRGSIDAPEVQARPLPKALAYWMRLIYAGIEDLDRKYPPKASVMNAIDYLVASGDARIQRSHEQKKLRWRTDDGKWKEAATKTVSNALSAARKWKGEFPS